MYAIELPGDDEPWLYRVSVREAETDPALAAIRLGDGAMLVPSFSPEGLSYVAEVAYASESVALDLRGRSRFLNSIAVNGSSYRGQAVQAEVEFSADEQLVTITTLAEDGVSSEQYEVTVVRAEPDRNSLLASLDLIDIDMLPLFDPQQPEYQVTVPYQAQQVRLSAHAQSEFARIDLSSEIVAADGARSLGAIEGSSSAEGGAVFAFPDGGRLEAALRIIAQDESAQLYRIVVFRDEPDRDNVLSVLSLLPADLNPTFQPIQLLYRAQVPFATTQISVVAQPRSARAVVALLGADVLDGQLSSAEGAAVDFANLDQLSVTVSVTAEDGGSRDYQLDIRRGPPDSNSALALLDVSDGVLRLRFAPRAVSYSVRLPAEVATTVITAFTESPVAMVAGADEPGPASGEATVRVELEPGRSRVLSLIVTAEDGSQRIYRVVVQRPQSVARDAGGEGSNESTDPATGTASGLAPFPGDVSVRSNGALRLQPREVAALAAASEQLESQAAVRIRYYRTDRVLLEDPVPIQVRQTRQTTTVILNYAARGIRVEPDRLLEIEVAIPTSGGGSVYYTEAIMTDARMDLDIPFLLHSLSPDVEWPSIGETVDLAGFVRRTADQLRGQGEGGRERSEEGEEGTLVEITDASGAILVRETVSRSSGLARGQVVTFARPVAVAEGATVRYRLTSLNRGGQQLTTAGTARVWTTQLDYNGGFQPARLFIVDEAD